MDWNPKPLEFGRFFLPGPTEVMPDVLRAMARPTVSHRGGEFRALIRDLQPGLGEVFRTARPVLVTTSSATGLMEAAIRNGAGPRLLCLVNGAFSHRFTRIASACGVAFETIEIPFGSVHDPEEVAARVSGGGYTGVTLVHSETSTGALQHLGELTAAIRGEAPDAMIMVDTVSSMAGAPVLTDEWGLDFVLTGGQKAMALPAGLSFGAASERFVERAASTPGRGMYFDIALAVEKIQAGLTPTTPAIHVVYALATQLDRILAEGMEARWARHAAMAERCWRWVEEVAGATGLPLRILAEEGARSPTVTCVVVPEGVDAKEVVRRTAERGWVIGGGYGPMAGETFRVGHMAEHTLDELDGVLEVVGDVLGEMAREATGRVG